MTSDALAGDGNPAGAEALYPAGRHQAAARAAGAAVDRAITDGACPAAVLEAGTSSGPVWRQAFGRLTFDAAAPAATPATVFDLASLTKVIVTTSLAMRLLDRGALDLDELVAARIPEWQGEDRSGVTVRDLLAHASGLPAHRRLHEMCRNRAEFRAAIGAAPLAYPPRTQSIYSDLGFILLGILIEAAGRADLAAQAAAVFALAAPHRIGYTPPPSWRPFTAPAGFDQWRHRVLIGEVHDLNAWALGGVAGHAGVFGDAAAVGAFAVLVLRALRDGDDTLANRETVRHFARRTNVPDSTRALGWDTMKDTSSCGTRMSPTAIGHTGFTGTSLWIDWERDLYAVLLTNRVHPDATNQAIGTLRPAFHDALVDAWPLPRPATGA